MRKVKLPIQEHFPFALWFLELLMLMLPEVSSIVLWSYFQRDTMVKRRNIKLLLFPPYVRHCLPHIQKLQVVYMNWQDCISNREVMLRLKLITKNRLLSGWRHFHKGILILEKVIMVWHISTEHLENITKRRSIIKRQ